MSLNAGSVIVELGGQLDPAAFAKYEEATQKAAKNMETAEKRIEKASVEASATVKAASAEQAAAVRTSAASIEESLAVIAAAEREQAAAATKTAAMMEAAENRKRKAVKRTESNLLASSKTWTNFGKAIKFGGVAAGVGILAFAGVIAGAAKKAAGFDQELANLNARSKVTPRQLGQVRKAALDLGTSFGVGATNAAQSATELVKGGLSVQKLLTGGLKGALALAVAGEMDAADAANTVANALNEFHLKGQDAVHVADALATAANATTADVKDFAMALSQGGAAAKTAGLSFDETTAFLEALAAAGVKNSDAGTSMKTALVQLANPTAKAHDLMKKLNLDFFDQQGKIKPLPAIAGMLRDKMKGLTKEQRLQAATTLAGTDGMRALLALYDAGPKKIKSFETGLQKQGTAAKVAAAQNTGAQGALKKLSADWEQAQIIVGEQLLPSIADGADKVGAKLKEMAADGSLKRMGDDLAQIATQLTDRLPNALDKVGSGVDHFGDIVDDLERAKQVTDFVGKLSNPFKAIPAITANPFQFVIEGARAALIAFKAVAAAYDQAVPGDQSARVAKVQGMIDDLDRKLADIKHKDIVFNFKVDDSDKSKIFDLTDRLDRMGKKQLAIQIVAESDSAEAAIAAMKASIRGVPDKVVLEIVARSQSAAEQVAAFNALAKGVPAKRVTDIQANAKTARGAILAFTAIANGVPASKVVKVLANTNSASAQISGVMSLIAGLHDKTVTITTLVQQVAAGSHQYDIVPRKKGHASGTKTSGPQLAMIGEGRDPVEWIIPRDPRYRDRAVGLLMDAAKSIIPGYAGGGKIGGGKVTASKPKPKAHVARFVPAHLDPIAYDVDDFDSRADKTKDAIDKSKQIAKNLANARTQLRRAERMPTKTAKQKAARKDSIDQANRRVTGYEKDLHGLPERGDLGKLRADWAERKAELAKAKAYQHRIDVAQKDADNAADQMSLADKRDDDKGYEAARKRRDTALGTLRTLLADAKTLSEQAGNTDRVQDLEGLLGQVDLDIADNETATPELSPAQQAEQDFADRLADTGMTDAERAVMAEIDKNIALDALTPDLEDDKRDAQIKVDYLQGILTDALTNPSRGGAATIAGLADQLKTAKDNLSSLAGGTGTNDNADLQAQIDQSNARATAATTDAEISRQALAAFQGFAAGGPGGLAPVININTLHPGDPKVWAAVAQTANMGNDLALTRRPTSVKVGL